MLPQAHEAGRGGAAAPVRMKHGLRGGGRCTHGAMHEEYGLQGAWGGANRQRNTNNVWDIVQVEGMCAVLHGNYKFVWMRHCIGAHGAHARG